MKTTKLALYRIFRKMGIQRHELTQSTNLNTDLFFDDWDMKIFLFFIESKFEIDVDDREFQYLQTVNNTIDFIESKIN